MASLLVLTTPCLTNGKFRGGHNLELLGQWQKSAISLGRPASYVERILKVTADYQRGLPLSEKTIKARQEDLAAYQLHMQLKQGDLSL